MRKLTKLFLVLVFGFLNLGNGCGDNNNILPSSIGHISSGVLAECNPNGPVETCMLLANPWKNRIFAFNLSRGQFVKSPTEISPLVIQAGPMTANLKSPGMSSGWVFGLDAQTKKIYSIRTVNKGNPSSVFASSSKPEDQISISLEQTPGDFAVVSYDNFIYAFVSYPRVNKIAVFKIDPNTGKSLPAESFVIQAGDTKEQGAIDLLAIAEGGSTLIAAANTTGYPGYAVISINISNLIENKVFVYPGAKKINLEGSESNELQSATVTKRKLAGVESEYALMLAKDSGKIELYDLINNKSMGSYDMSHFPQVGLLPKSSDNNGQTCCNGREDWFQVIDDQGELSYFIYEQGEIKLESMIKLRDNASFSRLVNLPINILSGKILPDSSDLDDPKEPQTAYLFETGLLFLSPEGIKSFTRIQPPI